MLTYTLISILHLSLLTTVTETYEIRITGMISTPENPKPTAIKVESSRIPADQTAASAHLIKPLSLTNSVNQCIPQARVKDEILGILKAVGQTGAPQISLDTLTVGDCYKNFCFLGFSHQSKAVEVSIFQNGEWLYATIWPNIDYSIKMDAITGFQGSLQRDLELYRKLLPERKRVGDYYTDYNDQGFTESGQKIDPLRIVEKLSQLSIQIQDGLPFIGPPVENCQTFRNKISKDLGGARETWSESDFGALEKSIVILCKREDGSNGYCDRNKIIGQNGCMEMDTLRAMANECGAPTVESKSSRLPSDEDVPNYWSTLERRRANAHNGKSCSAQSLPLSIFLSGDSEDVHHASSRPGVYHLKTGFNQAGYCEEGECLANEINECLETSSAIQLILPRNEFVQIVGDQISAVFNDIHPPQPGSEAYRRMETFFSQKKNRDKYSTRIRRNEPMDDNKTCHNGLCRSGKCVSFDELLSPEAASPFCQNKVNGHSCPTEERSIGKKLLDGNCYQGKCLLCEKKDDGEEILHNAPPCPNHPAFVNSPGIRKSCFNPDVCSYR